MHRTTIALIAVLAAAPASAQSGLPTSDWPAVGGDAGGMRWSQHTRIDRTNVQQLAPAWTFRTGEMPGTDGHNPSKFEATPVLAWNTLFVSTPRNVVIALVPETGEELWRFDPEIPTETHYSEGYVSRGVALFEDSNASECPRRVFLGTMDARLIAIDAGTGERCASFGEDGVVALNTPDVRSLFDRGQYSMTSPPAVIGDIVVIGSSIGDNRRVKVERGIVRGYDARTGELRWSWDPIPLPGKPGSDAWQPAQAEATGGGNAWGVLATDAERGLVFVPTGSAAPDFYGGERLGDNRYANSVVALRAETGEVAWHFQVVHHDLWDYDVPAQPVLTTLRIDGDDVPVVVQTTKMGHVFVLHRDTGRPVFPVEERSVPASDVPGEQAWPTQPFPTRPAPLHSTRLDPDSLGILSPEDRAACLMAIEGMRNEGMFTPPSLQGTVVYPSYVGGSNWGGMAVARESGIAVVPINRMPVWVRLIPRDEFEGESRSGLRAQFTPQHGTPYGMARSILFAPSGVPCSPPPWGLLHGVDLTSGDILWSVPIGRWGDLDPSFGSAILGGPMVTAGGLVFMAGTMDDTMRALDIETGEVLWSAKLPAGGNAVPMSYVGRDGRQYIVIAAGGHGNLGTTPGDYVVAFAF